jgi:hypothetical protein
MPSDNDEPAYSAGGDLDPAETPRDEDSVASLREGLILSDGSHLGSISAESIDPESIGNPPEDEFVDHAQQEGGGGRGNSAVKLILLGPEFGSEERIIGNDDIDEDGGGRYPQRQIHHSQHIQQPASCFFVF